MEGSSPQRNLEPLLRDDAGGPTGPRMGAYYAPPPPASSPSPSAYSASSATTTTAAAVHHPPHPHQPHPSPLVAPEDSYDLQLSSNDANNGSVGHGNTNGDNHGDDGDDLPPLPPLVSYCSYVRYGCAFGKWILLAVILNVIAVEICVKGGYFNYQGYWPVDSWNGGLLAAVWLATALWLYGSAKAVERDVQRVDYMAQYQQGRLSEDNTATNSNANGDETPSFVPDYEHIYGQVSRRIDVAFSPKSATLLRPSANAANNAPSTGSHLEGTTSSLVNLSFALWAVFFAGAVYLGTGTILGKHYAEECSISMDKTKNTTNSKNDFSNIPKGYPSAVQDWITEPKDPWGNQMRGDLFGDDYYGDDNYNNNGDSPDHNFPTVSSYDMGSFCSMKDGTVFFAGLRPQDPEDNDEADDDANAADRKSYELSDHLVLVESPGSGGPAIYHMDIVNPRMFLPVQNTLERTNDQKRQWVATQYCFTAAKAPSERPKKNSRTWEAMIRTTAIHCILTDNTTNTTPDQPVSFEIRKTLLSWKAKSRNGPQVTAASSGGDILIAHIGMDDQYMFQEVIQLNPGTAGSTGSSMTSQSIYHRTTLQQDIFIDEEIYWDGSGRRHHSNHPNTQCIQDHVQVQSAIASLVVLVLCGLWLILREGVPSGVSPLCVAAVGLIRCFTGRWDPGTTMLFLWIGAIFLHGVLCCGGGGSGGSRSVVCPCLPNWIGRDMYLWALYSWILSFFLMDVVFGMSQAFVASSVLFGLSGVILGHPIPHLMGYVSCAIGVVWALLWPFFGSRYGGGASDLAGAALTILLGLGMIGAGNCLSHNRRYCAAACRPLARAGRTMMYGGGGGGGGSGNGGSSSSSTAAAGATTTHSTPSIQAV